MAIAQRLVLDAAALAAQLPEVESLVDVGSGAGFPGLPIAILRPRCRITLIEARERRHHFQRAVVRELGLTNLRLELGRAESLQARPHAAAVAQAVAPPATAVRWMLRWASPDALLLLPASDRPRQVPEIEGVRFEEWRRYRVPCGGPERTLWMARAVA